MQCLMANPTNDGIRKLFTEIGCIMEEACLRALVRSADEEMDITARYRTLADAHEKTGELLTRIDSKI